MSVRFDFLFCDSLLSFVCGLVFFCSLCFCFVLWCCVILSWRFLKECTFVCVVVRPEGLDGMFLLLEASDGGRQRMVENKSFFVGFYFSRALG